MNKNCEIISLVYKSVDYLHFITNQMNSNLCKVEGWDIGFRLVANDPTEEVVKELKKMNVPFDVFLNKNPNEYYINRIYRAYNFGITSTKFDNVCLVNSDDLFSEGWLDNLLKHHDGVNIPCSRLIESGKMPSGKWGINLGEGHFGRHPKTIDLESWSSFVETMAEDKTEPGGLYMPCVLNKEQIIKAGLYPNGNIYKDGIGTCNGHPLKAGDDFFFHDVLEKKFGMKHVTVFDSLVYHIVEGERDA